jgi:acylpyruvate hydrolase
VKIICVARNYSEHIRELNNKDSDVPIFFCKPDTSIIKNNRPFFIPDFSDEVHHEVELVLQICRLGKSIPAKYAHRYYDKIGIGIDFTARDLQRECKAKGLPWEIAKGFEGSAPISRFLAKSEFPDLNNIDFRLEINGHVVQKGNSRDMIFSVDEIIEYVSRFFTLRTGDLIFTGTPVGVGPVKPGDRLQAFINEEKMMDFLIK